MEKKSNANGCHAKIQLIGYIQEVTDPSTKQKVSAYSKQVGNNKVANSVIVVNHYGVDQGDFWRIEAWATEQNARNHDFLIQYCEKGRQVFIEGTPILRKDENDKSKLYPTIRVDKIIGFNSGKGHHDDAPKAQAQAPFAPPQSFQPPMHAYDPTQAFAMQNGFQAPYSPPQQQPATVQPNPFAGQNPFNQG